MYIQRTSDFDFIDFSGIDLIDGTPRILTFRGRTQAYFSGMRNHVWSPEYFWGDGLGTFLLRFGDGQNLSSDVNIIKNSIWRERSTNRPRRVLFPASYYNGSNLDYLIAIGGITTVNVPYGYGRSGSSGGTSGRDNDRDVFLSFLQVEDAFTGDTWNGYKYSDNTPTYGRMCVAKSYNGYGWQRLGNDYYPGLPMSKEEWDAYKSRGMTPMLEHWQPESITAADGLSTNPTTGGSIVPVQNPAGLKGTVTVGSVKLGEYVYVFYNRLIDTRMQNYDSQYSGYPGYGYPPFIGDPLLPNYDRGEFIDDDGLNARVFYRYFNSGLCVARARISDLLDPQIQRSEIPFKKYRRSIRKNENGLYDRPDLEYDYTKNEYTYSGEIGWEEAWEPPIRGVDTSLISEEGWFGSISYNNFLQKYIYICQNSALNKLKIFTSKNTGKTEENLLNFEFVTDFEDIVTPMYYPTLVNEQGTSDLETSKECLLFYVTDMSGTRKMVRQRISFSL